MKKLVARLALAVLAIVAITGICWKANPWWAGPAIILGSIATSCVIVWAVSIIIRGK